MALPILAALGGQALVQVFTKPWPWIIIGTWFVTSKVDIGGIATEAKNTIFNLWWLVLLTLLLLIARQYLFLLAEKEKSARRGE